LVIQFTQSRHRNVSETRLQAAHYGDSISPRCIAATHSVTHRKVTFASRAINVSRVISKVGVSRRPSVADLVEYRHRESPQQRGGMSVLVVAASAGDAWVAVSFFAARTMTLLTERKKPRFNVFLSHLGAIRGGRENRAVSL